MPKPVPNQHNPHDLSMTSDIKLNQVAQQYIDDLVSSIKVPKLTAYPEVLDS